jgi:hypothetical protein
MTNSQGRQVGWKQRFQQEVEEELHVPENASPAPGGEGYPDEPSSSHFGVDGDLVFGARATCEEDDQRGP